MLKVIPKYAREYVGGGKQTKEKINAIASRLGVTATNVEINKY